MSRSSFVAGLFFVIVGVVFLLERLGVWDLRAAYVWPVLLIILGVSVIAGGRSRRRETPPD
jgi:drug/metabolite transporter (DMT)-like permease